MNKNWLGLIIVVIVAVSAFGFELSRHIDDPVRGDEAAWIFSTTYLTHLLGGEAFHPDWQGYDAVDQPPVAKYYYGVAARLGGKGWRTLEDKAWWFSSAADFHRRDAYRTSLAERIPMPVLRWSRAFAALAALAATLGLYALVTWMAGAGVGTVSALAFVASGMVRHFVPIVEADFLLIAFVLWQGAFLVRWMRTIEDRVGKSTWVWPLAAGLLLGFAVDTKLNALIGLPVTVLACAFVIASQRRSREGCIRVSVQSIALFAIAIFTAIAWNPTFLGSPDFMMRMVDHRSLQLAGASIQTGAAFASPIYEVILGWQYIFSDFGLVFVDRFIPAGLLLFVIGAVAALIRLVKRGGSVSFGGGWMILAMGLLWTFFSFWSFIQVLWLRYLLPAVPFVSIAIGLGAVIIYRALKRIAQHGSRAVFTKANAIPIVAGAVIFVSLWLGPMSENARAIVQVQANSEEVRMLRLQYMLKRHPDSMDLRKDLAVIYIRRGKWSKASQVLAPVAKAEPDDKILGALVKILARGEGSSR